MKTATWRVSRSETEEAMNLAVETLSESNAGDPHLQGATVRTFMPRHLLEERANW